MVEKLFKAAMNHHGNDNHLPEEILPPFRICGRMVRMSPSRLLHFDWHCFREMRSAASARLLTAVMSPSAGDPEDKVGEK